jgi:ABC-type Na+ efflux pump permease subunit
VNSHVGTEQGRVVVAGAPPVTRAAVPLLSDAYKVVKVQTSLAPPQAADLEALHAGRFIALASGAGGLSVTVYSSNPASVDAARVSRLLLPLNLSLNQRIGVAAARRALTLPVIVHGIGARPSSLAVAEVQRGIAFTLIFFLYLLVILNSQLTMAGIIEEKTNRIAELLVAAVDPLALLYGKILAGATLGMLQLLVWAAAALVFGSRVAGGGSGTNESLLSLSGAFQGALPPAVMLAFLFFLVVGLLQFSTIFAGIGSLISRPEDLGSVNSALILPIVAALIIAITALDAPDAPIVVASSFVPLVAPFTMFARIAVSAPPAWEAWASGAINLVALLAIGLFAGRLYRVGMLLYGRPPSLKQMWTTMRG